MAAGGPVRRQPHILLFLAAIVALLGPASQAALDWPTAVKSKAKAKSKVLYSFRDYQLVYHTRGRGRVIPKLQVRKAPKKPLSFGSAEASVEGKANKDDFRGFPYSTRNNLALQLSFPAIDGRLRLALEDPATSGSDADEAQVIGDLAYDQNVAGLGELGLHVKSSGEWAANLARQVEDVGNFRAGFNSQFDWSADLDTEYPAVKGVTPSVTYGATQDGIRVRAQIDGDLKGAHGSYSVQNSAGKYSPSTFIHEAKLRYSRGSRQTLEAQAVYNRDFAKTPVKGSLTYTVKPLKTRPVSVSTTVDTERNYNIEATVPHGKIVLAGGKETPRLRLELGV